MRIDFASTFSFNDVYPISVSETKGMSIGHLRLGQKGLLSFLENHLGLYSKDVHQAVRAKAYEQAIAITLESYPNLYISKSYEVDSWGVAMQLLKWRDELVLAAYDFNIENALKVSKRLHALCLIEQNVSSVPDGENERWLKVLEAITKSINLPIDELQVYEPKADIHPFYIHLFHTLESKSVKLIWVEFPNISNSSDLSKFQKKLSDSSLPKVEAINDGSLTVLKASNDNLLSECIGEILVSDEHMKPLLLIPERGQVLEDAIINRGLPAIGYRTIETDGSIEQLLHLITVFLWNPINPQKLLQFLSHPIAPISKGLRNKLASTYSRKSSISSSEWKDVIEEYLTKWSDKSKSIKKTIDTWFYRTTVNISDGVNQKQLISLYEDLGKWAVSLSSIDGRDDSTKRAFQELGNQCKQIISLVKDFTKEDEFISELQLNKWIESVDSNYSVKRNNQEIGAIPFITAPANLTLKSNTTIWWSFLNVVNPVKYATDWTSDELTLLQNMFIHSKESIVNQWFWQHCHAIRMTESKLILCIPDSVKGERQEAHPLYYDLLQTFSNPELIINRIALNNFIGIGESKIEMKEYSKKSLPLPTTHWQIERPVILEKREFESYSSLKKLCYYPHEYFLNYQLGIRKTEIPNITVSNLLYGNLVHSAVHQLWSDTKILNYGSTELVEKISQQLESTISEEGSILLLAEHEISLSQFRTIAKKSVLHLFKEIKNNQWTFVESEQRHQVKDEIGILGDIDLVLKRAKNEYVIVDLKWGGLSTRRDELINEQELQLIIYDKLLQAKNRKIHLSYYIITNQLFLSRSDEAFKDARVIPSNKSIDAHNKMLWDKMINTYAERYKELNEGVIEVGVVMPVSLLGEVSQIWSDETNSFLNVPVESKKKQADKYSSYNKLVGRI